MNIRILFLTSTLVVLLGSSLGSLAQGSRGSDRTRRQADYYFLFPVASSDLDLSFRDNGGQYDRMMSSLGSMITDRNMSVDRIVIRASSSPEGSVVLNERLWSKRADAVRGRIVSAWPELSDKIRLQAKGEDWAGLYEAVLEDPSVPNREQAADIIAMSSSLESRKYFLRQLDRGTTWTYISKKILPELRTASVIIFYSYTEPEEEVVAPIIVRDPVVETEPIYLQRTIRDTVVVRDTIREFFSKELVPVVVEPTVGAKESGSGVSLKTNLLYLLALQPNIEAEFYFARRWSLNLDAQVAWWSMPDRHIHYRYANFSPEARFWFRDNGSFTGNYLGLAVGAGLYDLSLGLARNNYEGYQGEFGTVSITYGHMWHIKNNFYIEAGLGIGYLFTEYRRYQYLDTHDVYQSTERLQMFVPTKLKINFVWRLGNGNRKGSVR